MEIKVSKKLFCIMAAVLMCICCLFTMPVHAQEFQATGATLTATVNADKTEMDVKSDGSLFAVEAIVPGDSVESTVTVKNETGTDISVELLRVDDKTDQSKTIAPYMLTEIVQDDKTLYSGRLEKNDIGPKTSAVMINKDETKTFHVKVSMPDTIGNEAQGKELDTEWVFQVKTLKELEKATATISVESTANKPISSGVSDIWHSDYIKGILIALIVAFAAVVVAYMVNNKKEIKENNDKNE